MCKSINSFTRTFWRGVSVSARGPMDFGRGDHVSLIGLAVSAVAVSMSDTDLKALPRNGAPAWDDSVGVNVQLGSSKDGSSRLGIDCWRVPRSTLTSGARYRSSAAAGHQPDPSACLPLTHTEKHFYVNTSNITDNYLCHASKGSTAPLP